MKNAVSSGMGLRQALRIADRLGYFVRWPRRTGEVVVQRPGDLKRVRINARRKDAPRCLIGLLLQLHRSF